jgi:phosphomannomutase
LESLLVSVSGIRGVVGKALTADVAQRYAAAFGSYLKGGRVVIGRDTRSTGPMIEAAATAGLLSAGCDVIDIGICPTPTVEMAVSRGGFSGGISVTASHNPDRYNALKLIGPGGLFLSEKQGTRVKAIYQKGQYRPASWERVGSVSEEDGWVDTHIKEILKLDIISVPTIRRRKLKVVVDCGGGAAGIAAFDFFSRIGVKSEIINVDYDGRFPRGPEPVPRNLRDLCATVRRKKADLGLAFDPDADRLAIVSEAGRALGEEFTLALSARYILGRKRGPMVVNLSSSLMNDFVAREARVKLYRTKVGERNVTEKLMRVKGAVGGEGNGGLIYPGLHWGRDAFLAAAVILQYLASSGKKISSLAGELPGYTMLKKRLKLSGKEISERKKAISKALPPGKQDLTDGIRISGKDWWVHIRPSNTEPITRLVAEAPSLGTARQLAGAVLSVFKRK